MSLWLELDGRAEAEPGAVDDAGVVELVEVDDVAAPDQAGDDAEVRLEAGGEGQRRRLAS